MLENGFLVDGKYKILDVIGRGGMSIVYLAINEKANRSWAVKELIRTDPRAVGISKKETDLLKKLHHPGIAGIVDVIEQKESQLIVMDYVEGHSLDQVLEEQGVCSEREVLDIGIQLCEVLEYLHTRKPPVIYRDLKPSNVMKKPDGKLVLIDFGAAREYRRYSDGDTVLLGTRGYAAPEQYESQGQTDARTDIYSLGVMLFELVTGESPHRLCPARKIRPELSAGLESILEICTQTDPAERFSSCAELKYALEHSWEMDERYQKRQKRKLAGFFTPVAASICLGIGGIVFSGLETQASQNTYEAYLTAAGNAAVKEEELGNYEKAICLRPGEKDAYLQLLKHGFLDDELLTVEESMRLRGIFTEQTASGESFESVFSKNKEGYAAFCYEAGVTYYYKYEETENKKQAQSYFRLAAQSGCLTGAHLVRAEKLSLIAGYYTRIGLVDAAGDDLVDYKQYWEDLVEVSAGNIVMTDNERTAVVVYEELIGQVLFHGESFLEAGARADRIREQLAQVRTHLQQDFTGKDLGGADAFSEIKDRLIQQMEEAEYLLAALEERQGE